MRTTTSKQSLYLMSVTALATALMLTSCKESELDTIKDAQMCLNKAAPSQAQGCVAKLANNSSEQANQLKCSAYFIKEELGTPTALIEAIKQSETSGSLGIISHLTFDSGKDVSQAAFNVCNSSGIPIYSQLSSLAHISTLAVNYNNNPADAGNFVETVKDIPAAELGNLVLTTYSSSCSTTDNSGSALAQYCTELSQVVNGLTEAEIGACLKEKLTGDDDPTCPP